jgi:hypothetical protein
LLQEQCDIYHTHKQRQGIRMKAAGTGEMEIGGEILVFIY